MTQEEYWFWLCNIKGLFQSSIKQILKYFDNPEEVYKASLNALIDSKVFTKKMAVEIVESRNSFKSKYRLDKLKKDGIKFVYYGSPEYPEQLLSLPDMPYSLYVKGNLPDPDFPTAGIIGSRTCSGYGKEMALKYSQHLALNGIQIISGMALGVDSYASKGALEAGGKTFVILGSGLDVIYPQENIELYYNILMNKGGIISEYPMGTAPLAWQFPHRNRLISAFSDKLLVIEARKKSGTLTTVNYALQQGKDIYALPGRTTDPLSEGCNSMIADGAGVLLSPQLLLESYNNNYTITLKEKVAESNIEENMDGRFSRIYSLLNYEPKAFDHIARELDMALTETAEILSEMEILGFIKEVSKDYYVLGS